MNLLQTLIDTAGHRNCSKNIKLIIQKNILHRMICYQTPTIILTNVTNQKKIFKKKIFKWFNLVIFIILNNIINSRQESSRLCNTFHKFKKHTKKVRKLMMSWET